MRKYLVIDPSLIIPNLKKGNNTKAAISKYFEKNFEVKPLLLDTTKDGKINTYNGCNANKKEYEIKQGILSIIEVNDTLQKFLDDFWIKYNQTAIEKPWIQLPIYSIVKIPWDNIEIVTIPNEDNTYFKFLGIANNNTEICFADNLNEPAKLSEENKSNEIKFTQKILSKAKKECDLKAENIYKSYKNYINNLIKLRDSAENLYKYRNDLVKEIAKNVKKDLPFCEYVKAECDELTIDFRNTTRKKIMDYSDPTYERKDKIKIRNYASSGNYDISDEITIRTIDLENTEDYGKYHKALNYIKAMGFDKLKSFRNLKQTDACLFNTKKEYEKIFSTFIGEFKKDLIDKATPLKVCQIAPYKFCIHKEGYERNKGSELYQISRKLKSVEKLTYYLPIPILEKMEYIPSKIICNEIEIDLYYEIEKEFKKAREIIDYLKSISFFPKRLTQKGKSAKTD